MENKFEISAKMNVTKRAGFQSWFKDLTQSSVTHKSGYSTNEGIDYYVYHYCGDYISIRLWACVCTANTTVCMNDSSGTKHFTWGIESHTKTSADAHMNSSLSHELMIYRNRMDIFFSLFNFSSDEIALYH